MLIAERGRMRIEVTSCTSSESYFYWDVTIKLFFLKIAFNV